VIVTVTANAALDRTVHEAGAEHVQAGGKGVNVARVLHALGVPVTALVVVGGKAGARIVEELARDGIRVRPVEAPGESRTCLERVDADARVTQVHGPGVQGSPVLAEALRAACREIPCRWIAVCGSLAPGLPDDTAARLVEDAHGRDVRSAADTSGGALAAVAAAGPELLRVNREELQAALGIGPGAAPCDPRIRSVGLGVVSDGAGAVRAWCAEGRFRLHPPAVRLRNPVGCGDAMMAGLLARLDEGGDAESALRSGVALSAADAESPVAGRPDLKRAAALAAAVRIERLS